MSNLFNMFEWMDGRKRKNEMVKSLKLFSVIKDKVVMSYDHSHHERIQDAEEEECNCIPWELHLFD